MTLKQLYKIIEDRKKKIPPGSYVASLFKAGQDQIIQKVGEEAVEVVIAANKESRERIISETADLIFHLLVMLSLFKIKPSEILKELDRRTLLKGAGRPK
ncbi:phosphoribosyl-ATP diphosphatase [Candidatus Daviesbacteria bacterium RIFCSPLOWO2_02_FULL_41_8]|uniref:Phosphoribosyl-ATP pyrophosphatase n=3 Tax=Candidatus Daviesiibacteriota TaxID=1752718 RepID=A0A1F5NLP8_9BACT|nr:MAG: phosphoribosyl-ATP diphosphatase [Candidatus Daviesbacteria bacterium RIFCSPHIGHO2_01_FULL_41_23]OGE32876.1 MAG: phosphoribosyl-ATP diphosphatase [Candidatus Daviesbacteria bacterium RIFCSPHIGHO2_02_FULL_41_10]OGE62376.1 MAG: phosphoribosyl-ATP diphosphatase [Candidatus Daviesbacteria bacterium RIFCSPLOWO2_01_FULL_41_32]OGE78548.1 MAG: phosphoribosyl-ATP diphosphatase [Candidatus Daviesbacteria bacterium RIFCSPLOWO2_02_FULL_41_8]